MNPTTGQKSIFSYGSGTEKIDPAPPKKERPPLEIKGHVPENMKAFIAAKQKEINDEHDVVQVKQKRKKYFLYFNIKLNVAGTNDVKSK